MNTRTSLIVVLLLAASWLQAQPKLVFRPSSPVDYGAIDKKDSLHRSFEIVNEGNQTLKIQSVRPGCGCTAALISTNTVEPGKSATVSFSFDPSHYKGAVTKYILVETNDPANPSSNFVFSTTVRTRIDLQPEYIVFANVKKDSTAKQTLTIVNNTKQAVRIKHIQNTVAGLTVTPQSNSIPAGGKIQLNAVFRSAKEGPVNTMISLFTTDPIDSLIEIRMYGFVTR